MVRRLRKKTKKLSNKIYSVLKRAPKRGIWLGELAKKVGVSRSHLNYYLFGSQKAEAKFGGYLRENVIIIRREGNNKYITLNDKN